MLLHRQCKALTRAIGALVPEVNLDRLGLGLLAEGGARASCHIASNLRVMKAVGAMCGMLCVCLLAALASTWRGVCLLNDFGTLGAACGLSARVRQGRTGQKAAVIALLIVSVRTTPVVWLQGWVCTAPVFCVMFMVTACSHHRQALGKRTSPPYKGPGDTVPGTHRAPQRTASRPHNRTAACDTDAPWSLP